MNRFFVAVGAGVAVLLSGGAARAQLAELAEGVEVGAWTFRPLIDVRVRGEYRHAPVDTGGDEHASSAVLRDAYASALPGLAAVGPAVDHQWLVAERARLGVEVLYDDVASARFVLQDARVLGVAPGIGAGADTGGLGVLEPIEANVAVHSKDDLVALRLGRQRVAWGEGRLLGDADFRARGRALDAAKLGFHVDDFDLEMLGALLAPPGDLPPEAPVADAGIGAGAQLYGLRAAYRPFPYFGFELVALGRVAREPLPSTLTPSDVGVADARFFGDHRGVVYSLEGAVEVGRVASYGDSRSLLAFAAAGQVLWTTSLPGKLAFGAFGAYASGEDEPSDPKGSLQRFDPILPDGHAHHGFLDLYGWSNMFDAGARMEVVPDDLVRLALAGAFVGLAQPADRWSTESLEPVGAAPGNESRVLGGEVDLELAVEPWENVRFDVGYGLFVLGAGGKAVLEAAGRGSRDVLHGLSLDARIHAP
ncbi:MAG: alginate export family protein [Polyangiaceae bacterium]|nr:alginate export family protein [Polyangiaceae bacterium]